MGIKQSIVVKSRFSLSLGHGEGSRGGTPGNFIMRYMSRDGAVENIAPTRLYEGDAVAMRYAAADKAAAEAESVPTMKRKLKNIRKNGGIAFGNGNVSLSDAGLRSASKEIQEGFNAGNTAIETVISFSEDYLRDNGILDPDFVYERHGDFRGHIDQMKLRFAIMNGVERMGRNFDDLHYVGVLQVDTGHVHCHLVMMDMGIGTIKKDGRQRGKLNETDKKILRRGIDSYLDEKQSVKQMSSSAMMDRRNALCYIKKFTYQTIAQQGFPQFLLACLPDNRNYWSANSNRREMRKPNALVREFVMDILAPVGTSPSEMYRRAHSRITDYADARQSREGFDELERMRIIRKGEDKLIKDCMNGVYSVMKRIPREEMTVRTQMLDMMSMDYESLANMAVNDPMMEFGFKLRSYSSRLSHHKKMYHKFRDEYEEYEKTEEKSEEAKALADHIALERDYQLMLMVKYQHFLMFLPPDDDVQGEFEKLMKQRQRLSKMRTMKDDPAFSRMGKISADRYGMNVYGISRASLIKDMPSVWDRRVELEDAKYEKAVKDFREKLLDVGMDFDGQGVKRSLKYPFDEVKALDLHHLGYDFPTDVRVSKANVDKFVSMANARYDSFIKAREYLERTGQGDTVSELMPDDVLSMKQFADRIGGTPERKLISKRSHEGRSHNGSTIRLGKDYIVDIKDAIRSTVETTRLYES